MKEVNKMSIVKYKDKRSGVTYVYESESYWDKEKKQPRSKRTLIGKLDETTGEIIPTGKSGRKKTIPKKTAVITEESTPITDQINLLTVKDEIIRSLKAENAALKKEKQEILKSLDMLFQKWSN
jgi:hypothetical protein